MRKILSTAIAALVLMPAMAWTPQGDKIKTEWAEKVTPQNVWQNYPRPQLKRTEWTNLNGLWQYAVTDMTVEKKKVKFQGEILVPFSIESSLSGVAQTFTPENKLWYRREFTVADQSNDKITLLHFGAVDYECNVWVNDKLVGNHKGGNNPFTFDITKYLKKKGPQVLELSVVDPTDTESITRGKQQLNQRGIWYTPVSGIWQTVWMETVEESHIVSILPQANISKNTVTLHFDIAEKERRQDLNIRILDGQKVLANINERVNDKIEIKLPETILWTPETPKLYTIKAELVEKNVILDRVESYFAMREVSTVTDDKGYRRVGLNGKAIFQWGTLDQGWWPDGLLTPPSAEAMLWDMVQLKNMGFNTIRKHIKVEPALYYYYADSLGIMMWQDMPSGYATQRQKVEFLDSESKEDWNAPADVAAQRQKELNEMIDNLRFFPSITTWVIFNEGWGQHNTKAITAWAQQKDPTRLINAVSGWTERYVGNFYDIHNYPATSMIFPQYCGNRISVLGEFGGLGLPVKEHLWNPNMRNWGYKNMDGSVDFVNDYSRLIYDLETLIAQGLSAAIYTQTTDVEGEVNGLITYDRKVIKLPAPFLNILHSRLFKTPAAKTVTLIADSQNGPQQDREITLNGVKQTVKTPYTIKGDATVTAVHKFKTDKLFANLSLWLNVNDYAKVKLNGVTVLDQPVRYTRHYNQYNISNFASYLIKGENILEIEVSQKENGKNMEFDFG
ncbi:MAG: glycoside hydrolase family 2 TIM barrel-domain containing protein, partial [Paludibacter sp.]|nr:glycoside hydrolase family 2 TIM barrel-domain containing protein [Paludibacter sp.]